MFKRSSILALIAVVFVVIFAACGGNDDRTSAVAAATMADQSDAEQRVDEAVASNPVGNSLTAPANPAPPTRFKERVYAIDVVKILKPSVVQIVTEIAAMGSANQPGPGMGVGTGVILDAQGNILTNNHVIRNAQRIMVTLNNGDSFPAELIGGDASTDIAVIKIGADGLQPATLGRSADLQVGEDVIAIGHALGLPGGPTVSKGVVSALGRSIDVSPQITMVDLIQTDTSINPGNSGGPLANYKGEVIGINTAVIRGSQGIGFAINIDDAKFVAEQLMARGFVNRGFLGITPINLSPGMASRVGAPVDKGILVVRTVPDSAADVAGLAPEDVIVELAGEPIISTGELSKFLVLHAPGETISVTFFRGSEKMTTQLTLGARPRL